jgi:hypothetical protein
VLWNEFLGSLHNRPLLLHFSEYRAVLSIVKFGLRMEVMYGQSRFRSEREEET